MKKMLIFVASVIWCLNVSAQLSTRASMDYFPTGNNMLVSVVDSEGKTISQEQILASYGHFRVRMGASYQIGKFKAYFDQDVSMNYSYHWSFKPLNTEWVVGLRFRLIENVEIRCEHMCGHPVLNDLLVKNQGVQVRRGYNMISIGYGY